MQHVSMPENVEAERILLSMLLFSPRQLVRVVDTVQPEHFYHDAHSMIYTAMLDLHRRNRSCSLANVLNELKRTDRLKLIGDEPVLRGGIGSLDMFGPQSIEDHADEILAQSEWRKLAQAGQEIFQSGMSKDADALERAQQLIFEIAMGKKTQGASPLAQAVDRYMDGLKQRRENVKNHVANGTPTGFIDLDRMLGGLQPSDFYVLAARPSKGKTALSLNIALNVVSHSKRAAFFSLEMSEGQLVQRLLSMETPTDQMLLRDGTVEDDDMAEIEKTAQRLRGLDLEIDEKARKLSTIKTIARTLHAQKPLQLIVIDYLQIMHPEMQRGRNSNRAEEVAQLSSGLKDLAKELNVPVLALAQLNRESEKRGDKRPQMSDLKESGAIEQDADCIMFIHCRDEQEQLRNQAMPYILDIIVDKHRNGRVGEVCLTFKPRSTKFEDLTVTPSEDTYYAR